MPPGNNERHKQKNRNHAPTSEKKEIDDYERYLIEEIKRVTEEIIELRPMHNRATYDLKNRELYQISQMHHHLRNFQLNN